MIGVVINYCSNEQMFIRHTLNECSKFTKDIIVSYGSQMYDGTPETFDETLVKEYPHVRFLKYEVDLTLSPDKLEGVVRRPTAYWCNLARWQGIQAMPLHVEWILFIDADEVPEGTKFQTWLNNSSLDDRSLYKLANYWYFKEPTNQSQTWEDSVLMVPRKHITRAAVFHDDERDGIVKVTNLKQNRMVHGVEGTPMFHHYSWVRTKEGLIKKIRTWAHRDDIFNGADAEAVVNYIYRNDDVNDVVHNYTYNKVTSRI
jgi:hypothetical protein